MHPYVHCSVIYNSQDTKQAKRPLIDEWLKMMWYIYTMDYYPAIKKTNVAICENMDGSRGYYAK